MLSADDLGVWVALNLRYLPVFDMDEYCEVPCPFTEATESFFNLGLACYLLHDSFPFFLPL